MKKSTIAAIGLVVAIVYPTSAWFLGKLVETTRQELFEMYRADAEGADVKVISRDYQRGIFGANETLVMEIPEALLNALDEENLLGLPNNDDSSVKPIRITVRTAITHGPLPGLSLPGAGAEESELLFEGELQKNIEQIFKGQKPLTAKTRYSFFGGGSLQLSSPAFTYVTKANELGESREIKWAGAKASGDFTAKMKQISLDLTMPKLELKESSGKQMGLEDLRFTGQYQRILDDFPNFYAVSGKLQLASIQVAVNSQKPPLTVKKITLDLASPTQGDFMDYLFKLKVGEALSDEKNLGSGQYDFSFRHLHVRTIAEYSRAAARISLNQMASRNMDWAKQFILALIEHQPEFRIDQLDVTMPKGKIKLNLVAKLDEGGAQVLPDNDPLLLFSLFSRLNLNLDLSLAQAIIGERMADRLSSQGFIQKEGGDIKTKILVEKGKFSANGKEFNPGIPLGGLL